MGQNFSRPTVAVVDIIGRTGRVEVGTTGVVFSVFVRSSAPSRARKKLTFENSPRASVRRLNNKRGHVCFMFVIA